MEGLKFKKSKRRFRTYSETELKKDVENSYWLGFSVGAMFGIIFTSLLTYFIFIK